MEVVVIDKVVFEQINQKLEDLVQRTKSVADSYQSICKKEKWLDTQEVCLLLGISKRALQNYKDRGILPYSYINRKNYYKQTDIDRLLAENYQNTEK
ncbi:helix-turn-helix domain-containing protein [Riemerella columbina]|uniref:helix-turn-helix domain-containing protein n=1 Tax=Riemerella columbina TaxID=103810 RepID=UPI00037A836C|nr:helix-turn-helix domain-containing protein [Riemerella columbina]